MGELNDILNSIKKHCSVENNDHYRNLSIGRGDMTMNGFSRTIWILNNDPKPTFGISRDITGSPVTTFSTEKKDSYYEAGSLAVSKNREFARILLHNYEGHHSCVFPNREKKTFLIRNSARYTNTGSSVINLQVGVAGDKSWTSFSNLQDALHKLKNINQALLRKQRAQAEAVKRAENFKKKQAQEDAKKSFEETKRLKEEVKQAEEEARKLEEEIEATKAQREAFIAEASKASEFIRKQVSLRRNPILDKNQDKAKFSNLYNGVAEVINGGPGTGKTTTMIQRLKFLIDREDLLDYIDNYDDCRLTKKQIDIISSAKDNWIYFSPTDLLKKYLQDNMNFEGLTNTANRTVVWKDFLKEAVRDHYHLSGQDCPFDFMGKKNEGKSIYAGNHMSIVDSFTNFFLSQVKERFLKISHIDYSKFDWKIQGKIITSECAKVKGVKTVDELLRFLIHMNEIDKRISVNGKTLPSGSDITNAFNEQVRQLTDKYATLLKRKKRKYEEISDFIKSVAKAPQEDSEDSEDTEELEDIQPDYGDLSIAFYNKLNPLIRKLALQNKDTSAKLTSQQKRLYELVKEVILDNDMKTITDAAYFVKYLNPALKGFSQFALSPIPQYYRNYRKSMSEKDKVNWDSELLKEMLETYKNRRLYAQEQSLLIGFINNIAKALYKASKEKFDTATHKYINAYKNLCRPVIGIDEATDYSLIEYYGIKSFGHYDICSYTLCGDIMQLMKVDGISDWNQLRHPLLFEKLNVDNLLVSYRQSEELLHLADSIYQEELKKPSPYTCYLKGENTPKPLWLEWDEIDEKAKWIAERVIEITKSYNFLPTIAIFTIDKQKAEDLKEALDDCEILETAGIDVKVCSDNTLEGEKTLRIFPIDQVKGMEFEAVFFYDIDDIESTSLINKYLYVGLSRASMYLAVTSNGHSKKISDLLQKYFSNDFSWS